MNKTLTFPSLNYSVCQWISATILVSWDHHIKLRLKPAPLSTTAVEGGPLNEALPGCSDLLREKEGVG